MMRRAAAALAGLLAAAAGCGMAGCGGGDDESDAQQRPTIAIASEPPDSFIQRTAKLLETASRKRDCQPLEAVNSRSITRFDCPAPAKMRRSMGKFEIVGTGVYGTGAVIDYRSGAAKDGASVVLTVGPDRNWAIGRFGVGTDPSARTDDGDSRAGFEDAVDSYLGAVREQDCAAFFAVTVTVESDQKKACKSQLPATKPLQQRLKDDPAAKPSYEGGNAKYGFFTIETRKPDPTASTISVIRVEEDGEEDTYLVMDVAPAPTAAERRAIEREAKKRLKQKTPPGGMAPSDKKPSEPAVPTPPTDA
jgi:hypothetical protein